MLWLEVTSAKKCHQERLRRAGREKAESGRGQKTSVSPQREIIKGLPFPSIRASVKLGINTDNMAYGNHTPKGPEWCFYKAHIFWKLLMPSARVLPSAS